MINTRVLLTIVRKVNAELVSHTRKKEMQPTVSEHNINSIKTRADRYRLNQIRSQNNHKDKVKS